MNLLSDIADHLASVNSKNLGLLGGETGRAIFFAQYSKKRNNNECEDLSKSIAARIFEAIQNESFPLYYSNGLTGILCGLNVIEALKINNDYSIDVDKLLNDLEAISIANIRNENNDLLAGSIGIILFFAIFNCHEQFSLVIENLDKSKNCENGMYYWKSYSRQNFDKNYINLGLSHGMAAILSVIGKGYHFLDNNLAVSLLMGVYELYRQNENPDSYYSMFPNGVSKREQAGESRLAWCYGDIGIGLSFLNVGISTSKSIFFDYGLKVLKKTIIRKRNKECLITDPFFCHGSSGVALAYLNAYKLSGELEFLDCANYWYEQTLIIMNQNKWKSYNYGILEGLCGIGLMLLSFESEKNLEWEELLLIK